MFVFKKSHTYPVNLMISLAILSAAIVSYEIQLIQFFSIVQWHHYAFMVISIAMLGFGASGTVISLFRKWLIQRFDFLLPFLMISTGLWMSFAVRLSRTDLFLFDSYTLFVDKSQVSKLFFTYLLFFLPFFLGALAIGLVFVKRVTNIGKYYFSDLLGAGLGGILAIALFWKFSPQEIPSIISFLPVLAGMIILPKKNRFTLIAFAVITIGVGIYHLQNPFDLSFSPYKGISYAKNLPDTKIAYEEFSPYGLLQIVNSPVMRYAPGLSLTYHKAIPSSSFIYNNGNWYAPIQTYAKKDSVHLLDYSTLSLPYVLGKPGHVLLLDAKGGDNISHALYNSAKSITVIENNESVISLLKKHYSDITDSLFFHPKLKVETIRSRTFLSKTDEKFDLIQLPLLGNFGGSAGLNALSEENLLTKESFNEMWQKLESDGMITVSTWMNFPYKIPLKLTATIAESLGSAGLEHPLDHVVLIRSWNTMTFVIKRIPLNPGEIRKIRSFCDHYEFDLTLLPGLDPSERSKFHTLEDEDLLYYLDGLFTTQREKIISEYDFNIQPATDNKPYFFQFLRWKKIPEMIKNIGVRSIPFVELGYLILIVTFVQVIFFALLFIIFPLFRLGWKGENKAWMIFYFSGLGFGYMFMEIVLIKHFVLYLGHPIYSVATVISVMLICSGIGSYYSSKLKTDRKTLMKITGLISGLILIYTVFIGNILSSTVGLEFVSKIAITSLSIAIPSFFMGMAFPVGLKMVDKINASHVPWAWGINGCITVISTSLAVIFAVELGFMALMLFAAFAYILALLSNFLLIK
ncbi:MAG: hypothetical protein ABFR32_07870 [Bacteroidota bacterium]